MRLTSAHAPSLARSLSVGLAMQAFVILGLVCALVYAATAMTLSARQDATLSDKKAMVRHVLEKAQPGGDRAALEHTLRDFLVGHDEMGLLLRLGNGDVLTVGVQTLVGDRPIKQLAFGVAAAGAARASGEATLYLDTSRDAELLQRLAWILAISALLGAVGVSLGNLLMVRRVVAPLHGLVQQLRLLNADHLEHRLDGALQPAELQPVIEQFNALLHRLDRAYRQLEAFNADVAHELNTPLTMLISSCQLGLSHSRTADELREILANNLEDLDRMAGIVRDMLFLAKADQGARVRGGTKQSLRAVAQTVLEFHEAELQEAGLSAVIEGDAKLDIEAGLLRRALSNLISNAVRYAERGSQVRLDIALTSDGEVELAIENRGHPIAKDELPRLFERFYRADYARSSSDLNHGLGLAIVEAIARMHGGAPFAQSQHGVTRVGMRLPGSIANARMQP